MKERLHRYRLALFNMVKKVKTKKCPTKKFFLLALLLLFIAGIFISPDSSMASVVSQKLKKYKSKYKNSEDKRNYQKVKKLKKENKQSYFYWKAICDAHKYDTDAQFKKISKTVQKMCDQYYSYKGYKNYIYYRDKQQREENNNEESFINTYTLTYTAEDNGSIAGTSPQNVNEGASGSAVTAIPDGGYHFLKWSDDSTDNPRTDTNVIGNISVTAQFVVIPFVCGTSTVQDDDGNSYGTVLINDQCWMASNLNRGTRINNSASQANNSIVEKWCAGDDLADCVTNGGGYSWNEMMRYVTAEGAQGICPTGWHIPSNADWLLLWSTLKETNEICDGMSYPCHNASTKMKVGGGSGFNSQLGSFRNNSGTWIGQDTYEMLWASSRLGQWGDAVNFMSNADGTTLNRGATSNISGTRIRCLKDSTAAGPFTITYSAGSNGSVTGTLTQSVAKDAQGTEVAAVGSTGYGLLYWDDGYDNNTRIDTAVVNRSYKAFFDHLYTATYDPGDGCFIDGAELEQHVVASKYTDQVTAYPSDGYTFVKWSDEKTEQARSDLINADFSVTAICLSSYTFTYNAEENGYISGTSPQTVVSGECGESVEAFGNEGWHFDQWDDLSTDNPRQDCSASGDITVSASFVEDY
jgi:trimeric autotransporter adhesin